MGVVLKNFQTPNHYNTLEPIIFRAASAPGVKVGPHRFWTLMIDVYLKHKYSSRFW